MFSEEALAEGPVGGEDSLLFKQGVYPGDGRGGGWVFDAVAGDGVVFHYFACAAAALGVYLVEDYGSASGDSDPVFIDGTGDVGFGGYGAEELQEVAAGLEAEGAADDALGDGAEGRGGLDGREPGRDGPGLGCDGSPGGELAPGLAPVAVAWRVEAVAAGGFVVAAAVFLYVGGLVAVIDVGGEAVFAAAGGAGEAGADAGVFEEVVAVVHTLSSFGNGSCCSECSECSTCGTGGTDGTVGSEVSAGMVMLFSFAFLRRRKTVVLAISRAEAISRTDLPSRWSLSISMISS